jgi:hypothetical protein
MHHQDDVLLALHHVLYHLLMTLQRIVRLVNPLWRNRPDDEVEEERIYWA